MNQIPTQFDNLIIGGGIVGLSLAWELANRGKRVEVVDAGSMGHGASWAGAGILPPTANRGAVDPLEQLRSLSHQLHAEWAELLKQTTGFDTGFRRCGGIYLARSPGEAATLAANRLWWDEHAIEYEQLSSQQLVNLEPNLADLVSGSLRSAWLLPDECQLRNPWHLKALIQACRQLGVGLREHMEVEEIRFENQRVASVVTRTGLALVAQQVCICAGAWTRQTLERLGFSTGIMPVRGQMILYQSDQPPISRIVNEGHRYLVPRSDGRLLAGSVEEEVGYRCETTEEALAEIRTWAEQILPQLGQTNIEQSWAGLRPGSFDGHPYLGRVPQFENLFVAAGHFRSGLHLSCATAVVMANLMEGKDNSIDLAPFRIGRG